MRWELYWKKGVFVIQKNWFYVRDVPIFMHLILITHIELKYLPHEKFMIGQFGGLYKDRFFLYAPKQFFLYEIQNIKNHNFL